MAFTTQNQMTLNLFADTTSRFAIVNKVVTDAGENTEGKSEIFVIPSGTADFTVDFGNMTSFDTLILSFSEDVDAVYLSTIIGAKTVAFGTNFIYLSGLSSETILHIDATSTSADVTVEMFAVSNE